LNVSLNCREFHAQVGLSIGGWETDNSPINPISNFKGRQIEVVPESIGIELQSHVGRTYTVHKYIKPQKLCGRRGSPMIDGGDSEIRERRSVAAE